MISVMNAQRRAARLLRGLLFIRSCIGCGTAIGWDEATPLCRDCFAQYMEARNCTCPSCGAVLARCRCSVIGDGVPLYSLLPYRPAESGRPDTVSGILLSRKRRLHPDTEAFLAAQMAALCECVIAERAKGGTREDWCLTYPPRSRKKQREVGHDQSCEMASRVSALTGIVLCPCLERVHGADIAQKTLGAAERVENAQESYRLAKKYETAIRGKRMILIDDIATTGATLAACASLLMASGAAETVALTAAKTVHGKR